MKRFIKFIILILLIVSGAYKLSESDIDILVNQNLNANTSINETVENTIPTLDEVKEQSIFSSQKVPDDIYEKMLGKSIPIKYKDRVNLSNLRYLQISYIGFDGNSHVRRNDCKF